MLQTLMRDYLQENEARSKSTPAGDFLRPLITEVIEDMPVQVEESDWSVMSGPERLTRKYLFNDTKMRNWFLRELFEDENNSGHHGKITVSGPEVVIEVWTHDIDAITELDVEYAGRCDDIYNDVALLGEFGYGY